MPLLEKNDEMMLSSSEVKMNSYSLTESPQSVSPGVHFLSLNMNKNMYINKTNEETITNIWELTQNVTNQTEIFTSIPNYFVYTDIISIPWVRYLLTALFTVGCLLAIIGNTLVILLIYKKRSLRSNPTIFFILNLAICDLVSNLLHRPLLLVDFFLPFEGNTDTKYNNIDHCKAAIFFQSLFSAVGFHTVLAISQERLLLIVFPLQAKSICSVSRAKKALVAIWLVAIACVLPMPLKYAKVLAADIDGSIVHYCGSFAQEQKDALAYFLFLFVFYFLIPALVLTVTYIKIFNTLFRRSGELSRSDETVPNKSMAVRRNLAKMMLTVAIVFVLAYGPNIMYFTYLTCGGIVQSNGYFAASVVELLPVISSCLNPFIYTLNSRTFRSGFKMLFCGRQTISEDHTRSFSPNAHTYSRPSSLLWSTKGKSTFTFQSTYKKEDRRLSSMSFSLKNNINSGTNQHKKIMNGHRV